MTEKKKSGRPLKRDPNVPSVPSETSAIEEQVVVTPKAQMKDVAYGITTLPNNTQVLVRIKYDAISGHTDVPEISVVGTDRMDAEERLKVVLAQELLRY